MTRGQFNNLKVGDIITLNRSVSPKFVGRRCPVTSAVGSMHTNYVCIYIEELGDRVPLYPDCAEEYVLSPNDNIDTNAGICILL